MTNKIEISAVVPVGGRFDKTGSLVREYLDALKKTGKKFELVYVLDGEYAEFSNQLITLAANEDKLRIIQLAKSFGEATALSAGFEHTAGAIVLTLPAYYQINPVEIGKLIAELDNCDVVVAARWPRATSSKFETVRRELFHWLIRVVSGSSFNDLGCGARALKRSVVDEVPVYGDQHNFLPLLAIRRGFHVHELTVTQSKEDRYEGGYGPRIYLRRLLDILTVVFLVRFTKKPLRLFGMIGSVTLGIGVIFLLYVIIERLFFGVGLADRPALLLSSLLVVLGMQLFALGLLGELIIFAHARDIKEYTVDRIINEFDE
jgi:glycosyltransferase involved in cell wall biosynthesis